jgi:hypothetical protein
MNDDNYQFEDEYIIIDNYNCNKCYNYINKLDKELRTLLDNNLMTDNSKHASINTVLKSYLQSVVRQGATSNCYKHAIDIMEFLLSNKFEPSLLITNLLVTNIKLCCPYLKLLISNFISIDAQIYVYCINNKRYDAILFLSRIMEPLQWFPDKISYKHPDATEIISNMISYKIPITSDQLLNAIKADNNTLVELFLHHGAEFNTNVQIYVCRSTNLTYITRMFAFNIRPSNDLYHELFYNLIQFKKTKTGITTTQYESFVMNKKNITDAIDIFIDNGYKLTVENLFTAIKFECQVNNINNLFDIQVK